MSRIKIDSIVSTEAWQFDDHSSNEKDRWSFYTFGEKWKDARVYGKVKGRSGEKWIVWWTLDCNVTTISSDKLYLEKAIPPDQRKTVSNVSSDSEVSHSEDPDYEPPTERSSDIEESFVMNHDTSNELTNGEEVYLCLENQSRIFRATYCESGINATVHGKSIDESQARFFIVKVLKS